MTDLPNWGPWSSDLTDAAERKAQLRSLQALVRVYAPRLDVKVLLLEALRAAETYRGALDNAGCLFNQLPTLVRRRVIATFAAMTPSLVRAAKE